MDYVTVDYLDARFEKFRIEFGAEMDAKFAELARMIAGGFAEIHRDFVTKDYFTKGMRHLESRLEKRIDANASLSRREYEPLTIRTSRLEDAVFETE